MFGSEVLDVAIGIIFVFLLVSIFTSAIREGIEGWLKTRATHLEAGIRELLHDPAGTGLTKKLFDHPLVYSLYPGTYSPRVPSKWPIWLVRGRNLPSYIPSRNFASALLDLAARGSVVHGNRNTSSQAITLQTVRANLRTLQNPPVERALLTAIDTAQGDLQQARANLEAWYDSAMDRVSGWYKRSTQWILLAIGFAIAVALNVNAITVADYLYRNKTARETLVARAQTAATDPNYPSRTYGAINQELSSLKLPIGGTQQLQQLRENTFPSLGGWLLTAIAASFGAPFWFDLLNKFMVVRSTVKPHQKSPEESSEDSQSDARSTDSLTSISRPIPSAVLAQTSGEYAASATPTDLLDGCGLHVAVITRDEDLPFAEGGIA